MSSIAFEEYKNKLNNLRPALDDLGGALHLDEARNEVEKLEEESAQDGFWNDTENSQRVQKRIKTLQHKLDRYAKLSGAWEDMLTMCEMAIEEDDDSMLPDLESEFHSFEETLESMRLETLLTGEYDANNAILTFHAGAGGTEAQDWTSMLYRMYNMWAERHGYTVKLMDYLDGDEAGIKSATIMIEGENAYGFLKSENGIHRLVRISPFDASGRRHTSFAAVEVMPEITEDSEIELRDEDIKMDVARAYGMVHPGAADTQAVRATFFIDPNGVLRAMVYYPMSNGRSIDEFVRLLQALQTSDAHGVATPENWCPGKDVIVSPPKTAEAADKRASEGYNTVDWYFSTKAL